MNQHEQSNNEGKKCDDVRLLPMQNDDESDSKTSFGHKHDRWSAGLPRNEDRSESAEDIHRVSVSRETFCNLRIGGFCTSYLKNTLDLSSTTADDIYLGDC